MLPDRPLQVGARGGHGPIRYRVELFKPSRRVATEPAQVIVKAPALFREPLRCGVVSGRHRAIGHLYHRPQPFLGSPATEPHLRGHSRDGIQAHLVEVIEGARIGTLAAHQSPDHRERFVEPGPPLLEQHPPPRSQRPKSQGRAQRRSEPPVRQPSVVNHLASTTG
jgi:hypothetical protein